ncbi:MAG: exodeoxyribonuclease VII large subunit [Methanomicrobiaceae archaeon]|nr:exodeoxyribonuclease VII large subunit [Methanomicrobiaceae archaeon]
MDWFGTQTDEEKRFYKTVSELSFTISRLLDDGSLKSIWVEGEITNFHRHASGHFYFSLAEIRDAMTYVINCAMWRSSAKELDYLPVNGARVRLYGSVEVYEPHGKYQFIARDIVPCGEGEKHILVQRWKAELSEKGVFDENLKKPLPRFPQRIGVVTASGGAVRRDIENIILRRYPVEIVLCAAAVQGDRAHLEIADAIRRIDGTVDVIIVGRGGGSFEDLFAFNHPDVVMAVFECVTPVVSAVGHEVDFTLCDFAADVRAPTPSAAAEIVVPDIRDLRREMDYLRKSLNGTFSNRIGNERNCLEDLRLRLNPARLQKIINGQYERMDDLSGRLCRGLYQRLEREKISLIAFKSGLDILNPIMPLKKGFCMIKSGDKIIKSMSELRQGQSVTLCMNDGSAEADIKEVYYDQKL